MQGDPTNVVALLGRGEHLVHLMRAEEALATYERAREVAPQDIRPYMRLASLLWQIGRSQVDIIAVYEQAAKRLPEEGVIFYNLGWHLREVERYEEALAAFERATALDPTDEAAPYEQGTLLVTLERYEEALATFDQAIVRDRDWATPWRRKGEILEHLGREAEAEEAYQHAGEIGGGQVYYERAEAFVQQERTFRAEFSVLS